MQVNCKCAETFSNMDNQEITSFNSFKPINNKKHSHLQKIPVQNAFSPEYEPPINNTYTVEKEEIVMSNFIIDDNDDDKISNIASPICDAPQLYMSPVSSASPITSSKIISCDSSPLKTSKLSAVSHAFNKLKNMISPNKVNDHSNITDDQRDVLLMLQRRNNNKSVFTIDINEIQEAERSKNIIISQNHMETLREVNAAEIEKKENKNITNDLDDGINIKTRKRNLEWITILNLYIAKTNDYCVFVYERHYFATRSSTENMLQLFMNADAHCQFSTCSCRLHAIISENGKLKVDYSGEIIHDPSELHSRPVRGSQRDELQKYTLLGSTPSAVRLHQLKGMSPANKAAGNRNAVGSSASVIRKIASEANVKLRRDKDLNESLKQLKVEQATKIFPAESIRGYLQEFNIEPLRLVCFTAAGIAIYNKFASSMPLSWDATGGIIVNRTRKIFYYELTISNLIKGGPSLPLTAMISASHGTMDIIHWLNCFIAKYKEAYGYSDVFPKPPVIHSDRALVFLLAGIQIFNNDETMDRYIERCWRIVNKTATKRDLEITVLHACLGHFMKNVKRNAAKELAKKQIPFGMWLMALLVNSNTLDEMIVIWRNICFVLLSPNQNDRFKMAISTLSKLAEQMNGDPEKTNYILQNVTVTSHASVTDKLNEQADDDGTNDDGLGEEEAVANMESSFKALFTSIYQETKEILKHYNNQQWQELPPNPLFSAGYLIRLLKQYMGIAPIWSNLLLGNFAQRYDYSSNDVRTPCMCHVGRTTGVSESQMRVLKETILHKKVYTRVDEVISLMGETIEAIEIQFTDYIFMNKQKNRVLPAKRHKPAQEAWNKRKPTKKQKGVYTSEKPPSNLVHMMNSQLLKKNDDILLDAEQPTQHFRFENKEKNSWFNSVCQMVFASRNLVETITQFGSIPASASVSDAITVTGSILHSFVTKSSYVEGKDAVVVAESIGQLLGHLRWAGVKICSRDNECVFKFFVTAIVSTLLYYKVDLQFTLNTSMECSSCGISKTYAVDRMHEIWSMRSTATHINDKMASFVRKKIICSSCQKPGLTNSVVYDIPKFLVLNTRSNDADCVKLIDEVDLLFVQPIDMSLSFEYSIQTAIIVLEEDQVIYLRKNGNNYLSYNKTTNQFEAIIDLTTQQTGLASNWTIFIYKTEAVIFDSLKLETIVLDQSNLQSAPNVDVLCIGVVQGLLPLFPRPFKVSSIQMEQRDINILLNESGNINDLIVNSHLRLIASNAPANNFVLVLDSLLVSNILRKDLKRFDATWFNYDIILCPIQQNNHWYLIILDIKKKLIVEVDTLSTVDIPRTQNLTRLLHVLNIQWLLRHKTAINFEQHWKLATPIIDKKFQQTDAHSCGVHLLIQARAYVNNYKFVHIPQDKIRLYRYQLAEDILRQAELLSDSSDSEVSY
ncbi:unnamed protein product [Adineta steineri]|uniref:Ubiquitin-like protease family profile domain-containing protein n=1 Tax=Adineta steineri TaxID=433720 RepID=A0A814AKU5_9BILA|nr:unnamed protein product [Adineta steineri]